MFLCFLMFVCQVNAIEKENVEFVSCVDGDTIKVKVNDQVKTVRFLAVDTPETVHPKKKVEYFGKEASDFTCNAVKSATKLELEYDGASEKEDKYNRLLAWIFVDDYLLQEKLIKGGYASVAYLYNDYKYTAILQDYEAQAKVSKIGIWSDDNTEDIVAVEETKKEVEAEENVGNSYSDLFNLIKSIIGKNESIFITLALVGIAVINFIIKK